MKKSLFILIAFLVMLFIDYRLLFIFLDLGNAFMRSDSDINSMGKCFLFFTPIITFGGVWIMYRAFNIIEGTKNSNGCISIGLSLYAGLLGVVLIDLALHVLFKTIESYFLFSSILGLSFVFFSVTTLFNINRHLTKRSSGR